MQFIHQKVVPIYSLRLTKPRPNPSKVLAASWMTILLDDAHRGFKVTSGEMRQPVRFMFGSIVGTFKKTTGTLTIRDEGHSVSEPRGVPISCLTRWHRYA